MDELRGKVALVAGATRGGGRGIAVALGEAGATVYCTGRSSTSGRPSSDRSSSDGSSSDHSSSDHSSYDHSSYDRSETIEETAARVTAAGGTGIAVRVDHAVPDEVEALVDRIDDEHGRLDVLVNDVWGGENLIEWDVPVWEHDLAGGLRMLDNVTRTHLITNHFALRLLTRTPGGLVVEMTDGTREYNDSTYRVSSFYDLAKTVPLRLAFTLARELEPVGGTAVALTPGWLRSEMMLEAMGVTEESWQDAAERHFAAISESPLFVGRAVAALAADPDVHRHNGGSFSSGALAQEYGFTDVDGSRPDCWRYLVEVQDAGLPADAAGYR